MPGAGPQHLYTGLLGMAPMQAVAYAPPPEPPKCSLALRVLIAAFGVLMGLILLYLVLQLVSVVTEHDVSTMAPTTSVEGTVHRVVRRRGTGSRPRQRRENLPGVSAEPPATSTAVTTSETQDEDPGKQSASSDGAVNATSKETQRLN
ncbi:hypothetical protein MTO96_022171 [Rhipicephalus appendiculatus]